MCPFCGHINLVREQTVAVPNEELQTDRVFQLVQENKARQALELAGKLSQQGRASPRLEFYRCLALHELGQVSEAVYALIDLSGEDAPQPLRADVQALLAEALAQAGRPAEAREAADRALQLLPGHPAAALTKASVLKQEGRLSEAAKLVERTLADLNRQWKISLPPSPARCWLLLARIYGLDNRPHKVIEALENLLLRHTGTDLDIVSESLLLLGWNTLKLEPTSEAGLELIRLGILAAGNNRGEGLKLLQNALETVGGDTGAELATLQARRQEATVEIRQVLSLLCPQLDFQELQPHSPLQILHQEPDQRVDRLQQAAEKLNLQHYDRGSLYPLRTLEDFRRWVVTWEARNLITRIKHQSLEQQRRNKLLAARQIQSSRSEARQLAERLEARRQRRRRRLAWALGLCAVLVLVTGLVFTILYGDLLWEEFSGRLLKVQCTPADNCLLLVDTGPAGRRRYRRRVGGSGWERLLGRWLDSRVDARGVVTYPLRLPFVAADLDELGACQGKTVTKERWSLVPHCRR